jgi:hypothetical protein
MDQGILVPSGMTASREMKMMPSLTLQGLPSQAMSCASVMSSGVITQFLPMQALVSITHFLMVVPAPATKEIASLCNSYFPTVLSVHWCPSISSARAGGTDVMIFSFSFHHGQGGPPMPRYPCAPIKFIVGSRISTDPQSRTHYETTIMTPRNSYPMY